MRLIPFVLVAFCPALAVAAPKPLAAAKHTPPVYLDVPSVWIQIVSRDDSGYGVKAEFRIAGATSSADRVRFDWKSGGKVVGTGTCSSDYYADNKIIFASCELQKDVKAKGPIDIDVVYIDDADDKEYLVTTLKTTVMNWKGIGKSQHWGHTPDDLLATAWIRNSEDSSTFHVPLFDFWSSANLVGEHQLRCTVDGKKLPDFEVHLDNSKASSQTSIESSFTQPKVQRTYAYTHVGMNPGFHYGSKSDFGSYDASKVRWAIDNPGKWDCMLRMGGKPVRQFMFTVNNKGMIEPSEMQKGKGALPTLPWVALIDMKIPKDNGVEKRIRADALKKSIGFGIPWPDHPKAKELQAAFPPTMGTPDK
ncbi:MAG: hypothetical protein H0T89_07435 [Deltaproteobacteria bacterium]|nr:hypothetical protein [Deltaproteobacteria bacterium]MDQ3297059.1 hypothetical protein [Myxococcota bacterium]